MATKYANLALRESEQAQVASLESTMANPIAYAGIPNKEKFKKELKARKEKLERITPPDLKGDELLVAKRRHDLLASAMVEGKQGMVPAMPTRREMEQAPAGAVDKHLNFEMFWKRHNLDPDGHIVPVNTRAGQQNLLHELKDHMRTLGKGSEEWSPNVANLDLFRKENDHVPLADTSLPRSYGLTPAARTNYDAAFPDHKPTPVERKLNVKNPCAATTKSGAACKSGARKNSPFCAFHRDLEPVLDAKIPVGTQLGA